MVTGSQSLLLSKENINRLFPFYFIMNRELIVEMCGDSMTKLQGGCAGRLFTASFRLIRPVENEISYLVLSTLVNKLILLRTVSTSDAGILIKGELVYLENEDKLLFTGTPWFNSIEELRTTNIMISDFPHHNPTVDLLHLLKTQEIINHDLSRLLDMVSEQKNTLKSGEKQILVSLQKERELSQLKSNFVTFASHEFRTPLACIRSSIELMQLGLAGPGNTLDNRSRHQHNILLEVDHLSELIDEFLTIGKIESNAVTCKKEELNLSDIARKIISNLQQIQDDQRSVILLAELAPQTMMADPLLLKHILSNLLSNSLKYSKGKDEPVLTIHYGTEHVGISILDFGIGVPYEQQPRIFQAFFRADNVHEIAGTGLGVFITKNFIELHGGSISFKSIPGEGTEFSISLPLT